MQGPVTEVCSAVFHAAKGLWPVVSEDEFGPFFPRSTIDCRKKDKSKTDDDNIGLHSSSISPFFLTIAM